MIRKTIVVAALAASGGLLSGCIAVPVDDGRVGYYQDRDPNRNPNYDRDRDGVPNRQDRRPDDSRRY